MRTDCFALCAKQEQVSIERPETCGVNRSGRTEGDRLYSLSPSVRPRGLEPLTFAAAVRRSNPLSYGRLLALHSDMDGWRCCAAS